MNTPSIKGKRIGAAIIDIIFIIFILFFSSIISSLIFFSTYRYNHNYTLISIIYAIIPLGIIFIYYTVFPYITKGCTLGKLIIGVKVTNLNYNRPTFLQLTFRNIFFFEALLFYVCTLSNRLMFGFIIYFLIFLINFGLTLTIFIMILSTQEERGLHDFIAKTYVVDKHFDIHKVTQTNAIERTQMDWAIFDDEDEVPNPFNKQHNQTETNDNEDEIEILTKKD